MAHAYREVRQTVIRDEPEVADTHTRASDRGINKAERVVYLAGAIIVALLGLRFVLALLGANPSNAFANLIYTLSHPFVTPFFGLFNYREQFGVSRFEVETLVAMLFWALLTWLITYLISLAGRGPSREV